MSNLKPLIYSINKLYELYNNITPGSSINTTWRL